MSVYADLSRRPRDNRTGLGEAPVRDWAPRGARLGVYLHLPFCVERCGYCSFNTAPYTPRAMDRFVAALLREIDLVSRASWSLSVTLRSVFLGGGTPSLATGDAMAAILETLRTR